MNEKTLNESGLAWDTVLEKAWKDADFKKELLANPRAVLNRELGDVVPEGMDVQVVEDTARTMNLVLPIGPDQFTDEAVADNELEVVGYAPSNTNVMSGCICCTAGCPPSRLRFGLPGLPGGGLPGGGLPGGGLPGGGFGGRVSRRTTRSSRRTR